MNLINDPKQSMQKIGKDIVFNGKIITEEVS